MNTSVILENLGGLDEICLLNNFKNKGKISILQLDPFNYALFIYYVQSCRISCIKLSLKELASNFNEDIAYSSNDCTSKIKTSDIYLLNVFCLPFTLLNVVCTKKSVWAVGQEAVINLTPYVEQALLKAKSFENDDSMDVDAVEEFQPNMMDIEVKVPILERYNLHVNDVFVGCHFLDYALIRCYENSRLHMWELEFLFSSDRTISADVMALSFLDFPVSYSKSYLCTPPSQDQSKTPEPLIVFIHHTDPENLMLRNIFNISCVSPNVVCLIGHPEGKLLWSLCDSEKQFHAAHNLQDLFNMKQAIVGIFFIKDIEGLEGLIFLKTKYGNLYLTQLKKSMDSETVTSSLPSLMNECLKQSNKMQELLNKKVLQNRLFATISTFASFKFLNNTLKEPLTFSISEVNEELKKYILVINLTCLDNLNLDPELCHVTSTVFTFFKNNNTFVTKCAPYKAEEPTLCLELIDTVLQPPFVSIFPLFVEVGLILQLPESWKTIDCFKAISIFLPFYIRIQTFMIHELNLLQNNALCFPQSLMFEAPKTLKVIKELGIKRPVSNALKINSSNNFNLFKKYNLCLSVSSVEEMIKNTCADSDPCKYIEKLLFGNAFQSNITKEPYFLSKCSPISISLSKNNDHIVITLTGDNSDSVIALRIAVMEILLSFFSKSKQSTSSSSYINIPDSIYRRCEEISTSLMSLYGKDVESDEITNKIINLYKGLRTDISGKLPIF